MAKRVTKKVNNTELDGKEFFAAIAQIEQEKGIKPGYMMEKISQALSGRLSPGPRGRGRQPGGGRRPRDQHRAHVPEEGRGGDGGQSRARRSAWTRPACPCPRSSWAMWSRIEVKPKSFGRIAAQTARQVIIQGIREAEQDMVYDQFCSKEHELLTGIVTRIDPRSGAVVLRISAGGRGDRRLSGLQRAGEGRALHRGPAPARVCGRGPQGHQGPPGAHLPHPPRSGQAPVRA